MPLAQSGRQLHNALAQPRKCTYTNCDEVALVTVNLSHVPVPRCTAHLTSKNSRKVVEDEYTLKLLREFGLID